MISIADTAWVGRTAVRLAGSGFRPGRPGLLRRTPDPDDQRRKRLHITDAGLELLSERREAGYGHLAELIAARLTPAEQRQLAASLPILGKLLD
ncbi:MarR family winged helix-turn-helix transcriptional regulator [Nocardia violaceofusca]|uniref:MarR family winged helix-turn-helix transcriptional regulator n=1 Tax=Nocardia violaceofusca TaxID=941182 RepID=UPI0012F51AA3|nr:hypothetical protein [Nocardia violaceofusca]